MTEEEQAERAAQDTRRASVKISVDKIRRNLTVIDVNASALADDNDIREAREACAEIDAELVKLTDLVRGLNAA